MDENGISITPPLTWHRVISRGKKRRTTTRGQGFIEQRYPYPRWQSNRIGHCLKNAFWRGISADVVAAVSGSDGGFHSGSLEEYYTKTRHYLFESFRPYSSSDWFKNEDHSISMTQRRTSSDIRTYQRHLKRLSSFNEGDGNQ